MLSARTAASLMALTAKGPFSHIRPGHCLSSGHKLVQGNHPVDQTYAVGLLRCEWLGSEQDLHGVAPRQVANQAHRTASRSENPPLGLYLAQDSTLRSNPDIGGQHYFHGTSEAEAVYGGNNGLKCP